MLECMSNSTDLFILELVHGFPCLGGNSSFDIPLTIQTCWHVQLQLDIALMAAGAAAVEMNMFPVSDIFLFSFFFF